MGCSCHCLRGGTLSPVTFANVLHFIVFCTPGITALSRYADYENWYAPVLRCKLSPTLTCFGSGSYTLQVSRVSVANSTGALPAAADLPGYSEGPALQSRQSGTGYRYLENNGVVHFVPSKTVKLQVSISRHSRLAQFSRRAGLVATESLAARAECTEFQTLREGSGLVWKVRNYFIFLQV